MSDEVTTGVRDLQEIQDAAVTSLGQNIDIIRRPVFHDTTQNEHHWLLRSIVRSAEVGNAGGVISQQRLKCPDG